MRQESVPLGTDLLLSLTVNSRAPVLIFGLLS